MLRDNLFTILSQRLGNRADLVTRMELEVQLLQDSVLEQHEWLPWFLETEMAETTTTAGEERIQIPSDFLAEVEEQALWRVSGEELVPMKKMEYDAMIAQYSGTGLPRAYAIGGEYLFLRYIPDDIYTLKMRYLAKDVVLTSNVENKWLKYASDLVLAELGTVMSEKHMQHFELSQTFRKDAEIAWNRLYRLHIARQESNMNRVMEA